jgi:hypothetical protein
MPDMPPDRIRCCVPFCRRTADAEKFKGQQIICGKHWRLASPTLRKRHRRIVRMYRQRFGENGYWHYLPGSEKRVECVRVGRLCDALWERCKREAIERAVGL